MNKKTITILLVAVLVWMSGLESRANIATNSLARSGRFIRGTGAEPNFHSFVVALDGEKGVKLDNMGDNADKYNGQIPWFSKIARPVQNHYNANSGNHGVSFQNPIVAFGGSAGGSSLYRGLSYRFGVFAGKYLPGDSNTLRIDIYNKSNSGLVKTLYLSIPNRNNETEWKTFSDNGYMATIAGWGLNTTLQFVDSKSTPSRPQDNWGVTEKSPFILTHMADANSLPYYFVVSLLGSYTAENGTDYPMVYDNGNPRKAAYSVLYAMDFEEPPPWRSTFIDQPHFEGKPLPPFYDGKTVEELLKVSNPMDFRPLVDAESPIFKELDQSPELMKHPILDKFVADMGGNPIALANYVLNEIELTDALNQGNVEEIDSEFTLNMTGMNRGALATFLEGQGSPLEQCALLVYLLRQAGYPAVYFIPGSGDLKMLSSRMSRVIRVQMDGGLSPTGERETPRLLSVNFPGVAVYVDNKWVNLFPWLKDTEIVEGLNLYDYMPAGFDSPIKWTHKYLLKDVSLQGLSTKDLPSEVFPEYIKSKLKGNFKNMTLDDIGVKFADRKIIKDRWSDFPSPWEFRNLSGKSLYMSSLRNIPSVFNTIQVEVSSVANSTKKVGTGVMRVMDLHNRRLLIRHVKTGEDQHDLEFTLAAFRPGETGVGSFDSADTRRLSYQKLKLGLDSTDDQIQVYQKHIATKAIESAGSFPWIFNNSYQIERSPKIRKGDLATFCMDVGRVSQKMLRVHAEEYWKLEREMEDGILTDADPEIQQGTSTYIMGMSYYEKCDNFEELNSNLHKVKKIRHYSAGMSKIIAKRDANGNLPNKGDIELQQPAVDMYNTHITMTRTVRKTLHTENGDLNDPSRSSFFIDFANRSSQEHEIINSFFNQKEAISTVKLLHLATPVQLTPQSYKTAGEVVYNSRKLKDWDVGMWAAVDEAFRRNPNFTKVYMTPGAVSSITKSYNGMGAFIIDPNDTASALISSGFHGGFGELLMSGFYSTWQTGLPSLSFSGLGDFSLRLDYNSIQNQLRNAYSWWDYHRIQSDIRELQQDIWQAQFNYERSRRQLEWGFLYDRSFDTKNSSYASLIDRSSSSGLFSTYLNYFKDGGQFVADPVNVLSGEFYIDAVDLDLKGPMPLQIRRNYSSFNQADNAYGYSWKSSYVPTLVFKEGKKVAYAAEVEGSTIAYTNSTANANLWIPEWKNNPGMHNVNSGTIGSSGNIANSRIEKIEGSPVQYKLYESGGGVRIFEEMNFDRKGNDPNYEWRPTLVKWTDAQGNYYTFSYGRDPKTPEFGKFTKIQSSNGTYINFNYDIYGHIVEAITSDGRRVLYEYDLEGDLRRVRRPDGSEVSYDYYTETKASKTASNHLLKTENKPDGNVLINEYDPNRRCKLQKATVGTDAQPITNAQFVYGANYTQVYDAYNRITTYYFNPLDALITQINDATGGVTKQEWFSTTLTAQDISNGGYPRSLKKMTDARGLITEFKYDSKGNVLEKKLTGDLSGNGVATEAAIYRYTYNDFNMLLTETDPAGNIIRHYYEDVNYPYFETKTEKYASGGTLIKSSENKYRNVVVGDRFANGLVEKQTVAAGTSDESKIEFEYNVLGLPTKKTQFTGTSDPNVVMTYGYNAKGDLIEQTNSKGQKALFEYDAMGRRLFSETRDENGKLTSWNYDYYDGNGKLVWSDGPRYNPEDYIWRKYDGAGRMREEIKWRSEAKPDGSGVQEPSGDGLYSTSFYTYDLVDNLTEVRNSIGNKTVMTYDNLGRMTNRKVYEGTSTTLLSDETWAYEPGGEVKQYVNPLNGNTMKTYTSRGQIKKQANPDSSTLEWRYYPDGRLQMEILSNGNYIETTYDDMNRTVFREWKKKTTGDVLARETEVQDRRGNVISRTDKEGNVFSTTYDGLNREKVKTGPAGDSSTDQQITSYQYDESGAQTIVSNGLGEREITLYDDLGRVKRTMIRDAKNVTIRNTSMEYSADKHSVVTYNGIAPAVTKTTVFNDTFGNPVVQILSDNNKLFKTYDSSGNLLSEKDETGKTTSFTYDGLNRIRTQKLPDGAITSFEYDKAGNILKRIMPGGNVWTATYDSASRKTSERIVNGNSYKRYYTPIYYYDATSPFAGLLKSVTDPNGKIYTTTYDDFLRPASVVKTGSDTMGPNLSYGYDKRGLLTRLSQTYPNSIDGPETVVSRVYDAYGQITQENIHLSANLVSSVSQKWDAAGRRKTMDPAGKGVPLYSFQYDAAGSLVQVNSTGKSYKLAYDGRGLLSSITDPFKTQIFKRYNRGSVFREDTSVDNKPVLWETLLRKPDNRIETYNINRLVSGIDPKRPPLETYGYSYNDRNQLITQSMVTPVSGNNISTTYGFDSSLLGIRQLATVNSSDGNNFNTRMSKSDIFGAISEEKTNARKSRFVISGKAFGAESVELKLDNQPLSVNPFEGWGGDGSWSANAEAYNGNHTVEAIAHHPSGLFSPSSKSTFRVQGQDKTLTTTYDLEGNVIKQESNDGIKQALTWDGVNRLIKISQRDGSKNGYDWNAVYDGLGRRLQTRYQKILNDGPIESPVVVSSWYDPMVEFLEIGYAVNGDIRWKVYGPDLNGVYGGLQGIGGLLGITQDSTGSTTGIINDLFGNVIATSTGTGVIWNSLRVDGYGPFAGKEAPSREKTESKVAEQYAWKGKPIDPTGLYCLGARYYNPLSGRFLSPDPEGHGSSINLYDYANGDPVNQLDPDGRLAHQFYNFADQYNLGTRALGGLQMAGGGLGFGASLAAWETGPLAAAGMAFSLDQMNAGAKTLWSGIPQETGVGSFLKGTGMGNSAAAYTEFGLGLITGSPNMVNFGRKLTEDISLAGESFQTLNQRMYQGMMDVNLYSGNRNCGYCSMAADATMAGYATSALNIQTPMKVGDLTRILGHENRTYMVYEKDKFLKYFEEQAPGSRFIIAGLRPFRKIGHAFNAATVSKGETVLYDTQISNFVTSGYMAKYKHVWIFRTHQGGGPEIWDNPEFHNWVGKVYSEIPVTIKNGRY